MQPEDAGATCTPASYCIMDDAPIEYVGSSPQKSLCLCRWSSRTCI